MARLNELSISYSRKNKTGEYESEEVFLAVKVEPERGDTIGAVSSEVFNQITDEVDRWSAKGSRVLVREAHGNVPPREQPAPQKQPPPREPEGPHEGEQSGGRPTPAPRGNGDYDYRAMKQSASPKSAGLLGVLVSDASNGLVKLGGISIIDAQLKVKNELLSAFQAEWKTYLNLAAPKTASQGQVSWAIDWLKKTYPDALKAAGRTDS
jgi:hypothetical protein